jgi:hypothetical protein
MAVCGGSLRRHRTAYCRLLAGRDLSGFTFLNPLEFVATLAQPGPQKLPLRKLEAFPRALLPVLLPFLHTGIARQKSILPQSRPQLRVITRDRSRQSHPHCPSLPANAAAMRGDLDVHLVRQASKLQRLDRIMLPSMIRKIILHLAAIDSELSATSAQKYSSHRLLAPASPEKPSLCARNGRTSRTQRSS